MPEIKANFRPEGSGQKGYQSRTEGRGPFGRSSKIRELRRKGIGLLFRLSIKNIREPE